MNLFPRLKSSARILLMGDPKKNHRNPIPVNRSEVS